MRFFAPENLRCAALATAVLTGGLLTAPAGAAPFTRRDDGDPFAVLDPQKWVNPDNMTWADYRAPPGTNWGDPSVRGSVRNFKIALVTVDYGDKPFAVTQPARSTIFGNPQPVAAGLARDTVPAFFRDLLNTPGELNRGHTLHEYWMGDSQGRYGVDLTAFGPYEMPAKSFAYGIDNSFNEGECPTGEQCSIDLRTDALGAWRREVGNATADGYELVFILSAGQDESATWQEFGEMRFQTKEDVPDSFGPPKVEPSDDTNYAKTRYVEWTSWASASTIWPNAGRGSSTQGESSGMGVYAHELSHLLSIGDNYNNPYGVPLRRAYTGPWSMMSRGSFNGPGGPHTRWQVPALQGGSMGSLHTVRDKLQLGLIANETVLRLTRDGIAGSGVAVARLTARAVDAGAGGLMGVRVAMDADRSPACNVSADVFCDGGGYSNYDVEVVDRMGADSFTPDSGVMISKTKNSDRGQPFQWTIDANPQDIGLVDFYRPDGSPAMVTLGDYRQLADALFHAGTRSGSEFEFADEANRLHFYVIDIGRDDAGVLSYTVGVRSLDGAGPGTRGAELSGGEFVAGGPEGAGSCVFRLGNTGAGGAAEVPFKSDVYRLRAAVKESGWRVELPNALATAEEGGSTVVKVAVGKEGYAAPEAVVTLMATSESDPAAVATAECKVGA